jgi:hypothetical protein
MEKIENIDFYIWGGFFLVFIVCLWLNKKLRQAEEEFQREVMQDER